VSRQFQNYGLLSIITTVIGYIAIAWLVDWSVYFVWITALSLTTFLLYGLDKLEAARHGQAAKHRVPENLLHLLALLGGFPGGWLGMFVFWHKIRKLSFWVVLVMSTLLHLTFAVTFYL